MNLKKQQCLVTGGAGFIGSHLVDGLIASGCRVRVLDNLANGKLKNFAGHQAVKRFEFINGSITDEPLLQSAMTGVQTVFHLACLGVRHSIVHPFENHRVNAEGTLMVLQAARAAGVRRFVYCSSSEVYGNAQRVPMAETHPVRPHTVYGASKLAGEAYARAFYQTYGLPVVIVRPFNTYGPRSHHEGDAGEIIPKTIVRAMNGRDILIFGDGSQTRDFTYVEDIARALALSAGADDLIGQTLNVGSGTEIPIQSLARKILARMGNSAAKLVFTRDRPGDVRRLRADAQKFSRLCGWHPIVDLDRGLDRTIDFFRSHAVGLANLMQGETWRNWEPRAH